MAGSARAARPVPELEARAPAPSGSVLTPGALWTLLLLAGAVYVARHQGVLAGVPAGSWQTPWPFLSLPRGGLAPWIVLAGAATGGAAAARLLGGVPRAVGILLGAFATLALPAQALELLGWASGRTLFRPWLWGASVALVALVLVLAALRTRVGARPCGRRRSASWRAVLRSAPPWVPGLAACAATVAALYLHAGARTLQRGARAWDGESYHLPVALQWIHLGSLTEPLARQLPFGTWGLEKFANPGNGHLLMALPMLMGWDRLACLVQAPFLLAAAWAVWSLARSAGASPVASAYAALGFLSAPIVAEQAAVPMQDLMTGALSLVAIAVLSGSAPDPEPPAPARLVTAGMALGLALGTKTTALGHAVLAAVVVVSSRWAWRGQGRGRVLGAGLLAAAIPSAFWYVRGALLFGNPIHPIRLPGLAEGTTAEDMSGTWDVERMGMTSRWEWLSFPFVDPEYSDETGFGALLVALGVLALLETLAALAGAVRVRRSPAARGDAVTHGRLALLLVAALVVFWFLAARTPRFNLPLLALFAAAAAPGLDRLVEYGRALRLAAASLLLVSVTLALSLRYHGWGVGPPEVRSADLEDDWPGIPPGIDALPPSVVYNDTDAEESSQPSNYKLFGLDHRHLVYDHPGLASGAGTPLEYRARLRALGVDYVFLRIRRGEAPPPRYAAEVLEPVLVREGPAFWSAVYRVR